MKQGGILVYKRNLLLVTLLILAVAFTGCIGPFKAKPEKITLAAEGLSEGNKVSIAEGDAEVKLSAKVQTKKDKEVKVDESEIKWEIDNKDLAELSAETGAKVTLTAKAVGKVKVTVKYEELDPATIEIIITEEEIEEPGEDDEDPVEDDEDPVEDANLILSEDFKDVTKEEFFSASYKSLPNDENAPMYFAKGGYGDMVLENGKLTLVGGRFTIGMPKEHEDTGTKKKVDGEDVITINENLEGHLDLSKPYKITIVLADSTPGEKNGEPAGNFQVYVDNNTTSMALSKHGGDSRLINYSCKNNEKIEEIIADENGIIELTPEVGTENSFIQIRTDAGATVVIESIKIEYVKE